MAAMLTRAAPVRRFALTLVGLTVLLFILRTPTQSYPDVWRGHPPYKVDEPAEGSQEQQPAQEESKADESDFWPRQRLPDRFQEYLKWEPPVEVKDHYPPYDAYWARDYDPNRWEAFPLNDAITTNATLNRLPTADHKVLVAERYLPYPEYNSQTWREQWHGEYASCVGPRGKTYDESPDDIVSAYRAKPEGYPDADIGSWKAVGLDENVCFDRIGRLGPYGLDTTGTDAKTPSSVDWKAVRWGKLQDECMLRNKLRFENAAVANLTPGKGEPASGLSSRDGSSTGKEDAKVAQKRQTPSKKHQTRTAILIRTWDTYTYEENDLQNLRSLVAEASLLSGGEYHVFLFVNIKDIDLPIYTDEAAYRTALEKYAPEEFRDMAILWSEQVCKEWYSKVGEWKVYSQQFMPVQWFSETHPEFDHVWNWEMDARLIGHHYHFLEQMAAFAAKQPRKYLWERNSRFYLPAVHGDYDKYYADTNAIVKSAEAAGRASVWGAQPWSTDQVTTGPTPPASAELDNFQWGVGEDADFITLLPLWDPRETLWSYRDELFNYPRGAESYDERPYPHVPRRVFINTLARFSRKLLHAMHLENKKGLSMASEMWPGSVALQHGLKAVYAPHPIWQAQVWPADYMDAVFNADGWGAGAMPGGTTDVGRGRGFDKARAQAGQLQTGTGPNHEGLAGRWSQERDAIYSPDREHNFGGWSWYFWSDFPKVVYWRWLGWSAKFSMATNAGGATTAVIGGKEFEQQHGRMCVPPMLMHPVKAVQAPKETDAPAAAAAAR